MKERPILFGAPMVRAILEGRKTQTRRVIKPQPDGWVHSVVAAPLIDGIHRHGKSGQWIAVSDRIQKARCVGRCPYGKPGDRLWVRETFCVGYELAPGEFTAIPFDGCESVRKAFYRATDDDAPDEPKRPWKPSIHMPRWASRITLEITNVRVERVQDISEQDAIAEGVLWNGWLSPCTPFVNLWNSINAARGYGWYANPWVWVIEFKRVSNA